jgi:putative ABC transport system ATP-binding protein
MDSIMFNAKGHSVIVDNQLLSLQSLCKSYYLETNEIPVLKSINFALYPHEMVSVVGSSGSGKSTLLGIVGLLDDFDSGTSIFDGESVTSLSAVRKAEIRNSKIGFVFQSFNLIDRATTLLNVEVPLIYAGISKKERTKRAREALMRVGLGNRLNHYPNQLSGGQKQRVAIARALINQPKILLADEPTGSLDSSSTNDIMQILSSLRDEGMAIILVTHDQNLASRADRQYIMEDGQIEQAN